MESDEKKPNMTPILAGGIVLVVLLAGGLALLSNNQTDLKSDDVTPAATNPSVTTEAGNESIKTFEMTAKRWEFTPGTITVNEGDTVKLNITSTDVTHGFTLSEFGVNETLQPNQTTTVEFVVDKKGTFSFFCSVFCGSGHSDMNGTLVVE